ncbi:hypothetical protein MCOR34_010269 [Pyricularia oryzae]|nr:hypothetical protein MCOR34_010269 [Pyricularia oryzae]
MQHNHTNKQQPVPKFTRPGARGRTKSRNGCLTCKQRRKKCDEARPTCGGCAVERWECEYPAAKTTAKRPWKFKFQIGSGGSATMVRPALLPDLTHEEVVMFSFYARDRMGSMDVIFNSSGVDDFIIKMSTSEPCVLQAVLAASYALRDSFWPAADHADRARDLAGMLRHYNLAIRELLALFAKDEEENRQTLVRRTRPDRVSAIVCASFVLATVDYVSAHLSSAVIGEQVSAGSMRTMSHCKAMFHMLKNSRPISLIDDGGRGAWDRKSHFDDDIAKMAAVVSTLLMQTSLYDEEVERFKAQAYQDGLVASHGSGNDPGLLIFPYAGQLGRSCWGVTSTNITHW